MPIVTLCRSCDTVMYSVLDRCIYCGSQCVDAKWLNAEQIRHSANRSILVKKPVIKILQDKL